MTGYEIMPGWCFVLATVVIGVLLVILAADLFNDDDEGDE